MDGVSASCSGLDFVDSIVGVSRMASACSASIVFLLMRLRVMKASGRVCLDCNSLLINYLLLFSTFI